MPSTTPPPTHTHTHTHTHLLRPSRPAHSLPRLGRSTFMHTVKHTHPSDTLGGVTISINREGREDVSMTLFITFFLGHVKRGRVSAFQCSICQRNIPGSMTDCTVCRELRWGVSLFQEGSVNSQSVCGCDWLKELTGQPSTSFSLNLSARLTGQL